ncbi:MAG: M23 family metallopeptidase [Gemmatimonadales bacterium]|nr:M23 family metallopeptidase [Gemmatimonadales bacterium]
MSTLFAGTSGPVPAGTRITTIFGYVPGYPGNSENVHYGLDLGVYNIDTTVPVDEIEIVLAAPFGGYGLAVVGRYDELGVRWYLLWGHLGKVYVSPGQRVRRGQAVGETDNTGFSIGAHLHFAVGRESYYGGAWVDPLPWVLARQEPIVPPDLDEEWFMSLTEAQKAALIKQATQENVDAAEWVKGNRGYLSPVAFAARDAGFDAAHDTGAPMGPVAKGIRRMDRLFRRLTGPVQPGSPPGTAAALAYDLSKPEGDGP